jgi:hypothetical protein
LERQPNALRLLVSFCGVNLLLAGLFVALIPHLLHTRVVRAVRVCARHSGTRSAPQPRPAFSR